MEFMRQFIHISLGLVLLALAHLFGLSTASYLIFYVFILYSSFLYATTMGWMPIIKLLTRRDEVAPGSGALYYLASALFLSSYPGMSLDSFSYALLALAIGDGFATLFGKYLGKRQIINGKSVEGSLAGFLCLFLAYVAFGAPAFNALLLSLIFVVVELFSPVDDNISIPLVVALASFILH